MPLQIGVEPKSKGKGKDSKDTKGRSKGKDAKNESSKKVKVDDLRRCCDCQKTGHVSRLKDLVDAEEKPVTANSHPNDTAAVVLLQCSPPGAHAMTCHMAMPCVEKKTPCEDVDVETMMRPDVGSTAPTGTERVKLEYAIPTCETFLTIDTRAGGGICLNRTERHNVGTKQLVALRNGRKLQVQHEEGDMSFPIVSICETSQRANWFARCQAMLPGLSGIITRNVRRTRVRSSWGDIEEFLGCQAR